MEIGSRYEICKIWNLFVLLEILKNLNRDRYSYIYSNVENRKSEEAEYKKYKQRKQTLYIIALYTIKFIL